MRPYTRRHALHGAVALLTGLAGCSGSGSSSRSNTATPTERGYPDDAVTAPEHYSLRSPDETPPVLHPADQPTADDETDETGERPDYRHHRFITTPETVEALAFGDVDGVDGAKQFLTATDFEQETVYLEQRAIPACYTLDLCYVRWGPDDIETQSARQLRPADVACEADAQEVLATFIRIPAAIDPDDVSGYGSGTSSGECRIPREDD